MRQCITSALRVLFCRSRSVATSIWGRRGTLSSPHSLNLRWFPQSAESRKRTSTVFCSWWLLQQTKVTTWERVGILCWSACPDSRIWLILLRMAKIVISSMSSGPLVSLNTVNRRNWTYKLMLSWLSRQSAWIKLTKFSKTLSILTKMLLSTLLTVFAAIRRRNWETIALGFSHFKN